MQQSSPASLECSGCEAADPAPLRTCLLSPLSSSSRIISYSFTFTSLHFLKSAVFCIFPTCCEEAIWRKVRKSCLLVMCLLTYWMNYNGALRHAWYTPQLEHSCSEAAVRLSTCLCNREFECYIVSAELECYIVSPVLYQHLTGPGAEPTLCCSNID